MTPQTQQPTDVGAYRPPDDAAADDAPVAVHTHRREDDPIELTPAQQRAALAGLRAAAAWLWRKHALGYVATAAVALWARVAHPTLTTAGGATAHDSVQDARLAAHLAYADTAASSSRAERAELRASIERVERKVDDVILVACAGLSEDRRAPVRVCAPARAAVRFTQQTAAGEVH